jgi:hypothetical protein
MAPLEELDDSTKGLESLHGAGLLWNCSIPITNIKGSYLYPCLNTTPSRPRLQHLLPKLMPRRQCTSCTRHQFVPSLIQATSSCIPEHFLFQAQNSPSAEWWRAPDRSHLYRMLWGKPLAEWCSLLTVNSCIKVRLDLQADKSPVVVKGPFFPRVVNPRYRIHGTNVWRKRWSSKAKQLQSSVKWNQNASR